VVARFRSAWGRLECRDHGRAGDRGGSRGRSRAWDAGIMVQCMIMEPRAGDGPAAAGAAPVRVAAAWSDGIMVGRVIAEDRAGGRAPGLPGSRISS
jgi:hypothetical protein